MLQIYATWLLLKLVNNCLNSSLVQIEEGMFSQATIVEKVVNNSKKSSSHISNQWLVDGGWMAVSTSTSKGLRSCKRLVFSKYM